MKLSLTYVLAISATAAKASTNSSSSIIPSYAPTRVPCPNDVEWIRPAVGLAPKEVEYVYGRKKKVLYALEEYLERLRLVDFDTRQYIQLLRASNFSKVPTLGYAISGGGWASSLTGTGGMRALDARFEPAVQTRTGGVLQMLTYMSGLSGGSWPIMSFATSNWPTVDEITAQWHTNINRLVATNTTQYAATATDIFEQMAEKIKVGFNVSIADYLGREFAYEFIPGPIGGIATTFSSVVNQSSFVDYEMPFPILQYNEIDTFDPFYFGLQFPTSNATIYDITPFEFGAWSGSIGAFTPTEYLGTRLSGGVPVNKSACIRGFDNAGFLIGTSADAFDGWYIQELSNGTEAQFARRSLQVDLKSRKSSKKYKRASPGFGDITEIPAAFEEALGLNLTSMAYGIFPNSFANLTTTSSLVNHSADLRMVDGSESGQAIPLWGQIQPARGLEFIIAWDDNSDAAPYSWNNGTNLYDTFLAANASNIPFPIIPPASTFVNYNYTHKPVFFGCHPLLTTTRDANGPIVLYFANSPYSAYTNYSYGQANQSASQMYDIYLNSFNLVTQGNGTLDPEWPACIGCAAIDRSVAKVGMQRTAQCDCCFRKYCWDGSYDNTNPGVVDLSLYLDPSLGFLEWNKTHDF